MARTSITKLASTGALIVLAAGAGLLGYRFLRAEVAAGVYRQRLEDLSLEYESLRGRYNEAVRQTVVTELVVRDGRLSVRVRDASGVLKEIATPYDPRREIYVDYVVLDSRLWIRRVFDSATPPGEALVIDPVHEDVDWDCAEAEHGKAVYRALGEGRWVVTVSGNGSLGLMRAAEDDQAEITSAPEIRTFDEEVASADRRVRSIGLAEVWRSLIGG